MPPEGPKLGERRCNVSFKKIPMPTLLAHPNNREKCKMVEDGYAAYAKLALWSLHNGGEGGGFEPPGIREGSPVFKTCE